MIVDILIECNASCHIQNEVSSYFHFLFVIQKTLTLAKALILLQRVLAIQRKNWRLCGKAI